MKRILASCVVVTLVCTTGCTTGIRRFGYQLPENCEAQNLRRCPIAIHYDGRYDSAKVDILGSIDAYDKGFSTDCDEAYVLDIFCKEACALGADIVNVYDEQQPDFWSTCYRASAEFLRLKDREQAKTLLSDAKYSPRRIISRSEKAKKRTRQIIAASVLGGALGGLVVSAATTPQGD